MLITSRFLALYGLLSLGALGAIVPYLAGRLLDLGLQGEQLGWVMAMFPIGRLVGGPIWGMVADRWRLAGWLIRGGSFVAFLGAIGLALAQDLEHALIATLLFSLGRVPLGPLIDALVLDALAHEGKSAADYGRIRIWGSGGFVGVAVLSGFLESPLFLGAAISGLVVALGFLLPGRGEGRPATLWPAIQELMRVPGFFLVCTWSALQALQVSVYDTFYGAQLKEIIAPTWVLPASLGVGVGVELLVMGNSRTILQKIPVESAFVIATLAAIPRWLGIAWLRDPYALVALQALHGLSFALFWLAAVQWFSQAARREIAASAQSLLASVSYGLGALGGALLSGQLQKLYGGTGIFLGLAAIGGVGLLLSVAIRFRAASARGLPGTP